MERLTTSRKWEEARKDLKNEFGYSHIWKRLNAIEGILGDDYDLDHLRDLVSQSSVKEGRCKVGNTVYQADAERVYALKIKKIIYDCGHIDFDDDAIGGTVFLTREAAEEALKGEQNG